MSTWSLNEMIDHMQTTGTISTPFTLDELSLAQAVAEAYYFSEYLLELPARAPEDSKEFMSFYRGIFKVNLRRGDLPKPDIT